MIDLNGFIFTSNERNQTIFKNLLISSFQLTHSVEYKVTLFSPETIIVYGEIGTVILDINVI